MWCLSTNNGPSVNHPPKITSTTVFVDIQQALKQVPRFLPVVDRCLVFMSIPRLDKMNQEITSGYIFSMSWECEHGKILINSLWYLRPWDTHKPPTPPPPPLLLRKVDIHRLVHFWLVDKITRFWPFWAEFLMIGMDGISCLIQTIHKLFLYMTVIVCLTSYESVDPM